MFSQSLRTRAYDILHNTLVHSFYNIWLFWLCVSVVVSQDIWSITVFEDHIYWTSTRSIYRANKSHGTNQTTLINLDYPPYDIHMYHPYRQPEGLYNLLYTTLIITLHAVLILLLIQYIIWSDTKTACLLLLLLLLLFLFCACHHRQNLVFNPQLWTCRSAILLSQEYRSRMQSERQTLGWTLQRFLTLQLNKHMPATLVLTSLG